MGRPKKKFTKAPLNLTLAPSLIEAAKAYAFDSNESLSELIERLLRRELSTRPANISNIATNNSGIIGSLNVGDAALAHNQSKKRRN
jgi:hypothetical protein